jgi:hypothetical protein
MIEIRLSRHFSILLAQSGLLFPGKGAFLARRPVGWIDCWIQERMKREFITMTD